MDGLRANYLITHLLNDFHPSCRLTDNDSRLTSYDGKDCNIRFGEGQYSWPTCRGLRFV
jgi:hypothetical protein